MAAVEEFPVFVVAISNKSLRRKGREDGTRVRLTVPAMPFIEDRLEQISMKHLRKTKWCKHPYRNTDTMELGPYVVGLARCKRGARAVAHHDEDLAFKLF